MGIPFFDDANYTLRLRLLRLWRLLIDFGRVAFGEKSGPLNHAEHFKKSSGSIGWATETPRAILADTAIVDEPVSATVPERAGHEYAFNEPIIVYHNGFPDESLTIKNLFHGDLRITANSRYGLIRCEPVQQSTKRDPLAQLPLPE